MVIWITPPPKQFISFLNIWSENPSINISLSIIFVSKWLSVTHIIEDSEEISCYSPFTINIQFTLFLLLLLVLGNDVPPNPGPQDYELSIFHLNARSVRNKSGLQENKGGII
jgi:hypothetical protein